MRISDGKDAVSKRCRHFIVFETPFLVFPRTEWKKKENFKETCSPPLELIHSSDLSGRGHGRVIVYGRVHGYALHHDKSGVTVEI